MTAKAKTTKTKKASKSQAETRFSDRSQAITAPDDSLFVFQQRDFLT